MRTRVKICGITRVEDALSAIDAGADAIGLVFYSPSPRSVTLSQAAEIVRHLPPFVTLVGLFVNEDRHQVAQTIEAVGLDLLQFHGDESPDDCRGFGKPYMKALRMKPDLDLPGLCNAYADASGVLLDTYKKGVPGGTGDTFNWELVPNDLPLPVVLAGGLESENIEQAINQVQPYAVDVSGGVEQSKGIKDPDKIVAFMRGVKRADQ